MMTIVSNTIQLQIAKLTDDSFLFLNLKRSSNVIVYPNMWQTVTGTLENNESALEATLREMKEETNLLPKEMWTVPYVASFFNTKNNCFSMIPVFGALVDDTKQVELSEEHSEYKWLNLEETLNLMVLPSHIEGTQKFYDYILNNKNKNFYKVNL